MAEVKRAPDSNESGRASGRHPVISDQSPPRRQQALNEEKEEISEQQRRNRRSRRLRDKNRARAVGFK